MRTIAFLTNKKSGTLSGLDSAALIEELTALYQGEVKGVWDLSESGESALEEALKCGADAIVVAGGDGTARGMAEALYHHKSQAALVPLPLGTANLLPKRLYEDRTPQDIMRNLHLYEEEGMRVACLDHHLFMIAIGVGFPTTLGWAREALRPGARSSPWRDSFKRIWAALRQMFAARIRFSVLNDQNFQRKKVSGLYITLPPAQAFEGQWICPKILEGFAFRFRDLGDLAGLGFDALSMNFLNSKRAHPFEAERLALSSKKPLAVMVDGEPRFVSHQARITLLKRPIHVLVPPAEEVT
ncbi:diacylglycerol/lipid kinase family protein [Woodsholea maritima]|uniref:diacylglycerol/lipid kinase family protein n=1 Tax=Woodsholea maritima TaxID=240237 RepID=UPI00036CC151|nr:diacylglycerol kinase family protein [Woodsholea maritima]